MDTLFADVKLLINQLKFIEMIFVDDLNAYRAFEISMDNIKIMQTLRKCQLRLHEWGRANQVTFDAGKESMTILSRQEPEGECFKILGVIFDPDL